MAQHDMNIANQSFPDFRTDLNNSLSAINSMHSGTSRPSGAVAGTMWLDTTSASSPTIKFFDGSDDISFATIDYSANTVNFLDSTVVADILGDTTPHELLYTAQQARKFPKRLLLEDSVELFGRYDC